MKNIIVRKSNFLIEASYKLSVIEQKIILVLVTTLKAEDKEFVTYPFRIKDLVSLLGITSPNEYKHLEKITKNLLERVLVLKNDEVILQTHWLSSAKYIKGKGTVELKFDSEIKPFLLTLKRCFTNYPLRYALQLRSQFSIRIYELLKQYGKIGQRNFEIEDLKRLLGINFEQYQQYADFKKRVILVAQKELAEKTDISFKFEEIKIGHGVGKIRFFIKVKPQATAKLTESAIIPVLPTPKEEKPSVNDDLVKLIALLPSKYREMESVSKILRGWLKEKGLDYVTRNIEYANDGSNAVNPGVSLGKGSNYRNYLAKALRGDFGLAYQDDKNIQKLAKEEVKRKAEKETKEYQQQLEQQEIEKKISAQVQVYINSLNDEALVNLRQEAIAQMEPKYRELVVKKMPGFESLIKKAMEKICRTQIKID